ncbi:TonB-dependent receptor [Novosphingobium pentaromativorans]|uniref:TonB-dependent receptor n=1 Tax=Novosphingobium pentaromativorans TaxID=205844 RepID=UPI00193AA756|nr:TonB-dependent receptor [Novosphingobium pentaromativorans]
MQAHAQSALVDGAVEGAARESQSDGAGFDSGEGAVPQEIVVTSRRRSERLQDVPQAVTAVSGDEIKKLAITEFQDVAAIVPGLSLGNSSVLNGGEPAPSLRGISFDKGASGSPTVDIYVNEVPTDSRLAYSAMYDVASIEVLRGPQGTLRGRTAPSGALTVSTRRPDPVEWGGYVSMLGSDKGSINGQAALNVPIATDVLAVRLAGLMDESDGNFVESVNGGMHPYRRDLSGRASIGFTPSSNLDAMVTYQYLDQRARQYDAVEGDGAVGGVVSTAPANYNGPALSASDRSAVDEVPGDRRLKGHQVTAQINWSVLGHRVSYVGGYAHVDTPSVNATDKVNFIPGRTLEQPLRTVSQSITQELRISSDSGPSFLDYTVGYFFSRATAKTRGQQIGAYLPGAFGAPGATPDPQALNEKFTLPVLINFDSKGVEHAVFGNVTLHLTPSTELSAGGRYIISSVDNTSQVFLGSGYISTPIGFPCSLAGLGSTYGGGACDVAISANPVPITDTATKNTRHPFVFNVSLSHRFSEQVLAYGSVASSWRRGGNNTYSNAGNDPTLAELSFLPPEKSTSYEVGLKTNLLDRRLRLNIAGYYQKFDGLLFQQGNIPYLNDNGVAQSVDTIVVNSSARAVVKGFDIDAAFQATPYWNIGAAFSYANGRVDDDRVPCRDSNFDGVADTGTPTVGDFVQAGTALATCKSNRSVSREPIWTLTAQSELQQPIGQVDGYLRGLLTYYARNPRRDEGSVVPAYGLLNLYAGVRSPDGAWDVSLFARNVTGTGVRTSRSTDVYNVAGDLASVFGSPGYRLVSYTPPREVGLQVRFSFGSR